MLYRHLTVTVKILYTVYKTRLAVKEKSVQP
jgi:hypothetical protein